jgi:L,D-peptidoglycan transpeptidase YkuD (ErfK/YbiS/YcfS/YnhG family)
VARRVTLLAVSALLLVSGCSGAASRATDSPIDAASAQLVVVTTPAWDAAAGSLRRYARRGDGAWLAVGEPVPVTVGRKGSAWGLGLHDTQPGPRKREGDGRAPAGVFGIGTAFGYASTLDAAWPYAAMDAGDWCIDVTASPLYNRIVDVADVGAEAIAGSTEPMRRDLHAGGDARYALGFVVEHNAGAVPDAGSCIFAHVWKAPGEATAGCTAMDEAALRAVIAWLDPAAEPVFVLLPRAEYSRLRGAWTLP